MAGRDDTEQMPELPVGGAGPQSSTPHTLQKQSRALFQGDLRRTGTLGRFPEIPGFPDEGNERRFHFLELKYWAGVWCLEKPPRPQLGEIVDRVG